MMEWFTRIIVAVMVCGTCNALNTWEIPRDNLLDHVTRNLDQEWLNYKKSYNKTYASANEELRRRLFWEDNVRYIRAHNAEFRADKTTFQVGENQFADMGDDEFRKTYLSRMEDTRTTKVLTSGSCWRGKLPLVLPRRMNWRQRGYVTSVVNQGTCNSCWAFATVGALEGLFRKRTKKLERLSEQNLLDCFQANYTCSIGGSMEKAFEYVRRNNGIDRAACYGYKNKVNAACRYKRSCSVLPKIRWDFVDQGDECALQLAVATRGPVAVAIDAAHKSFWYYKGKNSDDVYYEKDCFHGNKRTHAVTVVGYGTSKAGRDYWIIKNSWGRTWGDNGYGYMARNKGNNCQIAESAIFPY